MQDVSQRFVQAAEELRLSGRQLYRDGIVANDPVLSKIKNGWQKPTKKAIELFCNKYGVSATWMYTGEGNQYLGRKKPFEPRSKEDEERLFYKADFNTCIDNKGQPTPTMSSMPLVFPLAGDVDFWCVNNDKSLIPEIILGDIVAMKRLTT